MKMYSKLFFPGDLGRLDCSGWELHRAPISEHRCTIKKSGIPQYRLESWYDDRLWIWHLKFEFPGGMIDRNILDCSPLLSNIRARTRLPF